MREHLGVDVDCVMEEERRAELDREEEQFERDMSAVYDGQDEQDEDDESIHEGQSRPANTRARSSARSSSAFSQFAQTARNVEAEDERLARLSSRPDMGVRPRSFNHDVNELDTSAPPSRFESAARRLSTVLSPESDLGKEFKDQKLDVEGGGVDQMKHAEESGLVRGRDTTIINGKEVLVAGIASEGHGTLDHPVRPRLRVSSPSAHGSVDNVSLGNGELPPIVPAAQRLSSTAAGLPQVSLLPHLPVVDDTDIGGPHAPLSSSDAINGDSAGTSETYNPLTADIRPVHVTKDCMKDPINDTFFDDVWHTVAENNTKIFRRVFRCNPDNEVTNWHEYTEFQAYAERFAEAQGGAESNERQASEAKGKSGPSGAGNVLPNLGTFGEEIGRASCRERVF